MTEASKILEGVFAISKPPSLSSAQVLRDLQQHFKKSKTFSPLLAEVHQRQGQDDRHHGKRRRRDADSAFKMGHGGTLDPMATGVLIVGIGRGTKHLQGFLGCTKQYDTVVLFGKSTDTYDVMGKIVGEAPSDQITKEKVEEKLARFRGEIKQVPPIYSALKINGMKAYEYARSGKELPRELESRDMNVDVCELVQFYETGGHDFRWPVEEAPEQEKAIAKKLMKLEDTTMNTEPSRKASDDAPESSKQDASELEDTKVEHAEAIAGGQLESVNPIDQPSTSTVPDAPEQDQAQVDTQLNLQHAEETSEAPEPDHDPKSNQLPPKTKAALHTHAMPTLSSTPASSPAARISLVVSSGFYVRSFAHDLGISLDSLGFMAELTRSRQGDYIIPELLPQFPDLTPTLTYEDLEAGEEQWSPIITKQLEKWMLKNPLPGEADADGNIRADDRDLPRLDRRFNNHWNRHGGGSGGRDRNRGRSGDWKDQKRNSYGNGNEGRKRERDES